MAATSSLKCDPCSPLIHSERGGILSPRLGCQLPRISQWFANPTDQGYFPDGGSYFRATFSHLAKRGAETRHTETVGQPSALLPQSEIGLSRKPGCVSLCLPPTYCNKSPLLDSLQTNYFSPVLSGYVYHLEYAYPDTGLFCLFRALLLISNTQSATALVERPN